MADTTPDVNKGPEILIVCGTLVGFSLVMVALRIWVRLTTVRILGADDYCIIAAMTVLFAEMMVIIPEVRLGGGRHKQYIEPTENIVKGLHLNFVTQPLCLISLLLTKVGVGLFLLRITPTISFRRFIIGTIVFTILSAIGNFLTVFFQCTPLAYIWDTSIAGGTCIPSGNLKFAAFFNSSVSVLTDLIFALLPIPMLWKVQLNVRTKMAIAGILSLGIFATVAAIVKITYLGSYGSHGDFLFDSANITIWTTVEICAAMVAACFPALKPLFKSLLSIRSSDKSKDTYPHSGYIRNLDSQSNRHTFLAARKAASESNTFEMYGRQSNQTNVAAGQTDSKESILPTGRQTPGNEDGITKTTHVVVTVEEQQEKSVNSLF